MRALNRRCASGMTLATHLRSPGNPQRYEAPDEDTSEAAMASTGAVTPGSPMQMRLLCESPDCSTLVGWRDRALLATLASSGCRVSEVVTLTLGQLQST